MMTDKQQEALRLADKLNLILGWDTCAEAAAELRRSYEENEALAQPEPEPVTWHHADCEGECIACLIEREVQSAYGNQGLTYLLRHVTAPPPRKPLTDEEINNLFKKSVKSIPSGVIWNIVRTVEAAHGIKD